LGIDPATKQAGVLGLHDTFLIIGALICIALLASLARPTGTRAAAAVPPEPELLEAH